MSALSDPTNLDLTRVVDRDGDVRNEPWFQQLTGITPAFYEGTAPAASAAAAASTVDEAGDEARQRLRYLERQIRRWKVIAQTALADEARTNANAKVRDYQAKIREHLSANPGLQRQRYREQLHLGNQPPI